MYVQNLETVIKYYGSGVLFSEHKHNSAVKRNVVAVKGGN